MEKKLGEKKIVVVIVGRRTKKRSDNYPIGKGMW